MLFLKLSFQFCNHLIRHLNLVSLLILALLVAQQQLQYINVIPQAYPRIFMLTFSSIEKGASSWNAATKQQSILRQALLHLIERARKVEDNFKVFKATKSRKAPKNGQQ